MSEHKKPSSIEDTAIRVKRELLAEFQNISDRMGGEPSAPKLAIMAMESILAMVKTPKAMRSVPKIVRMIDAATSEGESLPYELILNEAAATRGKVIAPSNKPLIVKPNSTLSPEEVRTLAGLSPASTDDASEDPPPGGGDESLPQPGADAPTSRKDQRHKASSHQTNPQPPPASTKGNQK